MVGERVDDRHALASAPLLLDPQLRRHLRRHRLVELLRAAAVVRRPAAGRADTPLVARVDDASAHPPIMAETGRWGRAAHSGSPGPFGGFAGCRIPFDKRAAATRRFVRAEAGPGQPPRVGWTAKVWRRLFPHAALEGAFVPDVYAEMLRRLPPDEHYVPDLSENTGCRAGRRHAPSPTSGRTAWLVPRGRSESLGRGLLRARLDRAEGIRFRAPRTKPCRRLPASQSCPRPSGVLDRTPSRLAGQARDRGF